MWKKVNVTNQSDFIKTEKWKKNLIENEEIKSENFTFLISKKKKTKTFSILIIQRFGVKYLFVIIIFLSCWFFI